MGAKLVRDRVAESPWKWEETKQGLRPVRSPGEHDRLLDQKLLEEVGEFMISYSGLEILNEAADVIEVILTIVERTGFTRESVERRRQELIQERGGFTEGLVWET